jgi:hypothetical protein
MDVCGRKEPMDIRIRTYIVTVLTLISLGITEAGIAAEMGDTSNYYSTDISARRRTHAVSRRRHRGGSKPLDARCGQIREKVASVVGKAKVACYIKLFNIETDCNSRMPQTAGTAGNGYAAYGLCSIERSAAVRQAQGRGPDCRDISTIEKQTKCCQSMMKQFSKSQSYFGPVRRGEVAKCD